MSKNASAHRFHRFDFLILACFSLILFGYSIIENRELTGHEAVIPQNAREMIADHDWLFPKCGGLPWLERPPLPDWIAVGINTLCGRGNSHRVARIGPVLMGTIVVLLVARLACRWYGRAVGILSGLILATMWEFYCFSSDPEGDIFLCVLVTAAVILFVDLEYSCPAEANREGRNFLGMRPWPVLGLFILLGMTNQVKGLVFGTAMAMIPMIGFHAAKPNPRAFLRYVWLWGWLAFAGAAMAWPIAAYLRYPNIVDLWLSDYGGRVNGGFVGEPPWYYLTALPYVLMPWTIPALVGLWLTRATAFKESTNSERFLWIWALLPLAVFSIPDGKHHHYLLQCMAPWAILAALGSVQIWQWVLQWPAWLRSPQLSLLTVGIPGDMLLAVFASRIPGPPWLVPALMVLWPAGVLALTWAVTRANGQVALTGLFSILAAIYCLGYSLQTRYFNSYREDSQLMKQLPHLVQSDRPLFILFDERKPLETFHLLFYSDDRTTLLHNATFLLDDRIKEKEILVLGRTSDQVQLSCYGTPRIVLQSTHTHGEQCPDDRRTLFLLRFYDGLVRRSADMRISPMQANHRHKGPFLATPTILNSEPTSPSAN